MAYKRNVLLVMVVATLVFSGQVFSQNGTKPIVTSDVLKINTISQIDVSPDGLKAVFVKTSMGKNDKGDYRYNRHLWMINLEDYSLVQLTHGERSDSSPVWAPDSTQIAFVRAHNQKSQIWILSLGGGEAYPVTKVEDGAFQPQWSPDGKKLLFMSVIPEWKIEEDITWPYERPGRTWRDAPNWKKIKKEKKSEKETEEIEADPDGDLTAIRVWLAKNASEGNPRIFTDMNFRGELQLTADMELVHLFTSEVKPGSEAQQITYGMQSFWGADWSPDSQTIVCTSLEYIQHPDRMLDSDIWSVRADGSETKLLLSWEGYSVSQPRYSPDGTKILFVASSQKDLGYALSHLAIIPAEGGQPKPLTLNFDRSAGGPLWSPDGKYVYFVAPNQGAFPLYRINASGGEVEKIIGGKTGVRSYDMAGGKLVYSLTQVSNPYELYVSALDGKGAQQVTTFNSEWLEDKQVIFPQEKWLTRPDGFRVQYWIMEPANCKPDKKYPLALEIHGGPSAMWGPGEFSMWHEFQLLTNRGYGVVYCNPRGSGGYGLKFKKANYRNWGKGPAGDILAATSEAAKLDWVNPDQQVVTGGSYAGYMTAWLVSQDHRFKAAVAQRGVYEISVFFGEANAWMLVPFHYGGYPWEKEVRKYLDANSPLTYVADIKTPLMIIHADQDLRAGVIQSEILYKSLKVLNRPVEYVRYPQEGHELSRSGNPKRRMDRLNRIIEFFERYLQHE